MKQFRESCDADSTIPMVSPNGKLKRKSTECVRIIIFCVLSVKTQSHMRNMTHLK